MFNLGMTRLDECIHPRMFRFGGLFNPGMPDNNHDLIPGPVQRHHNRGAKIEDLVSPFMNIFY